MAYVAHLYAHGLAGKACIDFASIDAARQWAENYGTTADSCTITDELGEVVMELRRSTEGDGTTWYEAEIE